MSLQLIEKQIIYDGKRVRLEVHHLEDEERGGARVRKEVCVHPGAVVILPFLDDERILLIRNRRYTIGQILVELPAGGLERGEDPINAAGRELVEETGYLANRLQRLKDFYTSPGILTEKMYAFAAYDLEKTGGQSLEDDEEIEVVPVAFADAVRMIRDGSIQDGKTIATLLLYERFYRSGDVSLVD
jgi:ADP-ribose pyrophosphatase